MYIPKVGKGCLKFSFFLWFTHLWNCLCQTDWLGVGKDIKWNLPPALRVHFPKLFAHWAQLAKYFLFITQYWPVLKFLHDPVHIPQRISRSWAMGLFINVHIFWKRHKILRNLLQLFVLWTASQIIGRDFEKCCGLIRIGIWTLLSMLHARVG